MLNLNEVKDLLLFCKKHGITAIEFGESGLKACVTPDFIESPVPAEFGMQQPDNTVAEWES